MSGALDANERAASTGGDRRPVILLILAVVAVAALLHARVVVPESVEPADWLLAVALAVSFVVATQLNINLRFGRQTHSLTITELPLIAGLVWLPPALLVASRLVAVIAVLGFAWRQQPTKFAFNIAQTWLETVVAVAVWNLLLGAADITDPRGWAAVLGTTAVTSIVSATLIAAVIALSSGRAVPVLGSSIVVSQLLSCVANASLALVAAFVITVDWRGLWTLALFAAGFTFAYRAYNFLQRRNASLSVVAQFSNSVVQNLHAEAVATTILREVRRLLQVDVAELVLFDDGRGPLRVLSRRGQDLQVSRTPSRALVESFMPPAWDGTPVLAPRNSRDAVLRACLAHAGLKDALVVALQDGGRMIGTLLVADRLGDVDTFDEHERTMLIALANHSSSALRNGRLVDRLRLEAQEKEYQALHDALTGLPNRTWFLSQLAGEVADERRAAVLLMDLDRFKEINDTLGHHLGDHLLVEVAHRLADAVPSDALVARLGGDEFVVCLPDAGVSDAVAVADTIRKVLAQPLLVEQIMIEAEASIGAVLAPAHGADATLLLQRADVAMYAAKASHSGFEVYDASRDQYSPRRLALLSELRRAIERGELVNYYQPKVTLDGRKVVGVEALVRWLHPRHGMVPPNDFIPLAEQTGLIRPLTLSVLREALSQCARWRDHGLELGVSVNLSPRSFADERLADDVEELLAAYALPRRALTLEITEGSMMADPERAVAVLRRLSMIGVDLSIDDFGTGYSSLAYLKRLPVDEIKVDRSFIRNLVDDPSDAAIVKAVVELAHRLGMRVVAEGVEDQAAFEQLARLRCDEGQGYWMSRPLPASAVEAWVADWSEALAHATPLRPPPSAMER